MLTKKVGLCTIYIIYRFQLTFTVYWNLLGKLAHFPQCLTHIKITCYLIKKFDAK